jgi:hypothetical protein
MFKPRALLFGAHMDKWLKVSIVAAVLLAGAGAFHYSVIVAPGIEQARRSAIEDCHRAARMVYDVHWAAACTTQVGQASPDQAEGHAECELPDDKAAVVNAWLNEAEKRCMAEVRADIP